MSVSDFVNTVNTGIHRMIQLGQVAIVQSPHVRDTLVEQLTQTLDTHLNMTNNMRATLENHLVNVDRMKFEAEQVLLPSISLILSSLYNILL